MYGWPSCSPTSKIVTMLGAFESRAAARASRVKRARIAVVVGVAVGEHLDRDDACEIAVLGSVDLAHAAAGDPLRVPVSGGQTALTHGEPGAHVIPAGNSMRDLKVR